MESRYATANELLYLIRRVNYKTELKDKQGIPGVLLEIFFKNVQTAFHGERVLFLG